MSIEHLSAEAARNLVAQAERAQAQAIQDAIALARAKRLEAATQAVTTGLELYRKLIKQIAFYAGTLKQRETEAVPVGVWSSEERELGRFAVDFAVTLLRKVDEYQVEVTDTERDQDEFTPGGWQTYTCYMIRLHIRW